MDQQYKQIPKEGPATGTVYCPWCGTGQTGHLNVHELICVGCGRTLHHDGKNVTMPDQKTLQGCSDAQLKWMLSQYCLMRKDSFFVSKILDASQERMDIIFACAETVYHDPNNRQEGWKLLLRLADEKNYNALATVYNAYFSEDFKYQAQLKKYSEILVKEFGDLTAADTLRTILEKEGKRY